ncbi:MAG TPA: PAS domain-containing protein [Chryseosolibacter sp.]
MLNEGTTDSKNILSLFEVVANSSPSPILLWDTSGNCTFANKRWHELTGSSPEQNFGKGWLSFIHVDDRAFVNAAVQALEQGPIPFRISARLHQHKITLKLALHPGTADGKTRIVGWMSAEELPSTEVERRISLLETMLDSTISMISVIDRQLNLVYCNREVEQYTGVKKADVIGRNVFDAFPRLNNPEYKRNMQRALAGEMVQSPVAESILQKGKFLETFYIPLRGPNDQIEGVIVKIRDRTIDTRLQLELMDKNKLLEEQNKSLARQSDFIQSMFDATIDVIAVIDTNFRYVSINKRAMERYGLTKEAIAGKHILELFPSVKQTGMYRDLERALKGEFVHDRSYTSEVLHKSRFENYYVPLRDEQNKVYAVMIIGHDVTDIMRANEKLQLTNTTLAEKNRELERSNNDLEQFAYVASHDLQEPIRKIATYANKLLTRSKESLSEETVVYLERINNSTRRMYELINGLLEYSKLTRQQALFSRVSLQQTITHVTSDFDLKIRSKKAVINIQNQLPEIEAIPIQMNQLFSNLIGNSLKFAKQDVTPVIQIASLDLSPEQIDFYSLDPKGKYFSLFYLDNGIGFDQQFADKIFELFQRLHEKSKYEGSGIGLAICKKIISNHHGLISVFSEEGKGTTFHIILPYSQKF